MLVYVWKAQDQTEWWRKCCKLCCKLCCNQKAAKEEFGCTKSAALIGRGINGGWLSNEFRVKTAFFPYY